MLSFNSGSEIPVCKIVPRKSMLVASYKQGVGTEKMSVMPFIFQSRASAAWKRAGTRSADRDPRATRSRGQRARRAVQGIGWAQNQRLWSTGPSSLVPTCHRLAGAGSQPGRMVHSAARLAPAHPRLQALGLGSPPTRCLRQTRGRGVVGGGPPPAQQGKVRVPGLRSPQPWPLASGPGSAQPSTCSPCCVSPRGCVTSDRLALCHPWPRPREAPPGAVTLGGQWHAPPPGFS